jgi:MscS family membrane protein
MVLSKVYRLSLIGTFTFLIIRLIDFFAIEFLERQDFSRDGMLDRQLLPFVRELLKIFVVIVAFFFGLGFVFELNVANIIAGLGLGGLAVALAAKESMENLFASFTIFLDKPFVVGDQVTVDGITGSIEKVGFRSTRIRTLDQSLVSLPNKILIDHALENQTLRTHRKIDFLLTIEYSHSMQELEGLLSELRSLVAEHPRFSDDSLVRLFELGENGFQIRILLIAEAPEFSDFLGLKEEFHLKILQLLETNAIRLAFPTRKVHLVSPSGPPTNQAL